MEEFGCSTSIPVITRLFYVVQVFLIYCFHSILKDSDGGELHLEILGFWALSDA
jgi:hypothetical protein